MLPSVDRTVQSFEMILPDIHPKPVRPVTAESPTGGPQPGCCAAWAMTTPTALTPHRNSSQGVIARARLGAKGRVTLTGFSPEKES